MFQNVPHSSIAAVFLGCLTSIFENMESILLPQTAAWPPSGAAEVLRFLNRVSSVVSSQSPEGTSWDLDWWLGAKGQKMVPWVVEHMCLYMYILYVCCIHIHCARREGLGISHGRAQPSTAEQRSTALAYALDASRSTSFTRSFTCASCRPSTSYICANLLLRLTFFNLLCSYASTSFTRTSTCVWCCASTSHTCTCTHVDLTIDYTLSFFNASVCRYASTHCPFHETKQNKSKPKGKGRKERI